MSNPKNFEAKYLKNCTRLKVKRSQIGSDVWAFKWLKYFDLRWLLKIYGQGQTLKALKSNIFKTVLYGGKMSIEDRYEIKYKLSNGAINDLQGQKSKSKSKPKKFEVKQFNPF